MPRNWHKLKTKTPHTLDVDRSKLLLFIGVAALAVAAGASAAVLSRQVLEPYKPAIEIPGDRVLPDFTLTDQNGNPFTLSSVKGKAVLIYFGYTHCPDVCPLVMTKYAQLVKTLGNRANDVALIFITVDPERDTVDAMKKYVSYYSEKIIALTGTPEEIEQVARLYNVFYTKQPPDEQGNYLVDHYALVLGADRQHILRLAFTPDMPFDEYQKGVEWLLTRP